MKKKTKQEELRETESPQLGKDLQYSEDDSVMELPDCCLLYTSPSPRD